ncbi:MAG: hypothetical protein IKO84_01950 [Butyrivibrio sp.]|nr:hypothetical protein [Butyrivibrio sp.]
MKKRVLRSVTGLLAVGVLGVTVFIGVKNTYGICEVETAEYVMSENLVNGIRDPSSLTGSEAYKEVTNYTKLADFERSLSNDKWVAHVYLKGYKGDILLVADTAYGHFDDDLKREINYAGKVSVYTDAGNRVRCIGFLSAGGSGGEVKRTDDGVLFANNHHSTESYLVTADGLDIVHKDYVNDRDNWGYVNATNDPSKKVEFANDKEKINQIYALNDKAKTIPFTHPQK